MFDWKPDLSVVADIASLMSLIVSAYAAYAITKVRSQVVDRVRLPALVEVLEKHGKNFAKQMGTYEEAQAKESFLLELAMCEANLRLVRSKVGRTVRARTKLLLREITKYKRPRWFGYYPAIATRDQAWKIYADLNGLIEELNNVVEERRMGV